MKSYLIIFALLVPACATAQSPGPWTDNFNEARSGFIAEEARPFIIRRQGCDHFRGEYDGEDDERQRSILKNIAELCTGSDEELKRLRIKYANQPETIKALVDFEDCIEYNSVCSEPG